MAYQNFRDAIILFGGVSEERLVSVASAQNLSAVIPEAHLLFMGKDEKIYAVNHEELITHQNAFIEEFSTNKSPFSESIYACREFLQAKVVIIAFHGNEGTTGRIQNFFERKGIAFTASGSKASALAFDKLATKTLARKNKVQVVEELLLKSFDAREVRQLEKFLKTHKKIVLKPVANGSSVGLFIISDLYELHANLYTMQSLKTVYMAEPFIHGREVTVGTWNKDGLSAQAISSTEICLTSGHKFDYSTKYLGRGVEEFTPARFSAEEISQCQQLAVKMHELVGCRGYSRTDMILTDAGPVLMEINTLPGLSKISFIPQQLMVNGISLRDFFRDIISHAHKKERPALREPFYKKFTAKLADKLKSTLPVHVRLSKYRNTGLT